jgi:hypothetical protein
VISHHPKLAIFGDRTRGVANGKCLGSDVLFLRAGLL